MNAAKETWSETVEHHTKQPNELTVTDCLEAAKLARWAQSNIRGPGGRAVLYLIGEMIRLADLLPENTQGITPD